MRGADRLYKPYRLYSAHAAALLRRPLAVLRMGTGEPVTTRERGEEGGTAIPLSPLCGYQDETNRKEI